MWKNYSQRCMHPYVHYSIICSGEEMGMTDMFLDRWLDKKWWYICIHTHMYTHIHTYKLVYIYTYMYTYARTCVYTYICIHVYVCLYMYTHIHNGILLSHKKRWCTAICDNVDLENIMLNEIRAKVKNHMISLMWDIKLEATNEQTRNK